MVRVLDSRTGLSRFDSHSGLNFFTLNLCFVKDNIKQDLDLEPVKVNSTTSKAWVECSKIIFSFLSIYAMVHSILNRFLTVHIGTAGDYILALV